MKYFTAVDYPLKRVKCLPMSKEQLAELAKNSTDVLLKIVEEFAKESDRAAVILGAAKFDAQLYQLLAKVLIPVPGNVDDLLDGDAPLSTFSAKINLAGRLGLIDARLSRALHLVRRIRNAFAHEIQAGSLEAHRDRVRELRNLFHGADAYVSNFRQALFKDTTGVGIDFRCLVAMMILRLDRAIHDAKPLSSEAAVTLATPEMLKATHATENSGGKSGTD